ncbi:MAG: hypothetical protein K2L28_05390, partial [Muribaculaceae bacterium]|nr:hypothetical protein [Muribaculaceae bacterium]
SILANSCRLLIPVFLTVCIFSSQIIKLLFGDAWLQSAPYLSILFIAGIFLLFESLYRNFVKSLGEVGLLFKYTLYKRLFTILLIVILALVQSDLILYGYCFGAAAGLMINIVLYSKVIKTTFIRELKSLINYSLPALVSALIIYVICLFTTKPLFCYIAAIVMWGIYFGVYLKGVDYVLKLRNKLK